MGYEIHCFKDYEIRNNNDYSGEYEFEMIDYSDGDYVYPATLDNIGDYLKNYNLYEEWRDIIPNYGEVYFEGVSKEEAEYIEKRLVAPNICLEFMKNNKVVERIITDKPEYYQRMMFALAFLLKYWKEGYYVIMTY